MDLSLHQEFVTNHLRSRGLLVMPSQGEEGTKILTGIEGEMLYEHRQEGQAIGDHDGIFVSRCALPVAEEKYRQMVFGSKRPVWVVPNLKREGVPLDQIALADEGFLTRLAQQVESVYRSDSPTLYGFNVTDSMQAVADALGIKYYGNSEFAKWAGTKIGLQEFAKECGVPTPLTFELHKKADIKDLAEELGLAGYGKLVIKVSHSTGGMGHSIHKIDELLFKIKSEGVDGLFPEEYMEDEGGVVQGFIEDSISASMATFVDFDGSTFFEGAQAHLIDKGDSAFGAVGATPITEEFLNPMLEVGRKLAVGYAKHRAWGSHTMGMLIVPPEVSRRLGLPEGVPLCNDENARPGASTISKAWIQAVRDGRYGVGWMVSKIEVPKGAKIADAIEALDASGLLIREASTNAQGIFVYNGSVLDSGYEKKFYALAVSAKDDHEEAKMIMQRAVGVFK